MRGCVVGLNVEFIRTESQCVTITPLLGLIVAHRKSISQFP